MKWVTTSWTYCTLRFECAFANLLFKPSHKPMSSAQLNPTFKAQKLHANMLKLLVHTVSMVYQPDCRYWSSSSSWRSQWRLAPSPAGWWWWAQPPSPGGRLPFPLLPLLLHFVARSAVYWNRIRIITECPKIYRKNILHLLKHRFAVILLQICTV